MILDTSLLNTQHNKEQIKGKGSNPVGGSSSLLHVGVVAIEKEAFGFSSTTVGQLTSYIYLY